MSHVYWVGLRVLAIALVLGSAMSFVVSSRIWRKHTYSDSFASYPAIDKTGLPAHIQTGALVLPIYIQVPLLPPKHSI